MTHDHRSDPKECGDPYPKEGIGLFCVKPLGHDEKHATLLGIHPEFEDSDGQMWPAQEEWAEW